MSRPSRRGGSPAPDPEVTIAHHRVHDLSPEGIKAIAEGIAKKRGRPSTGFDKKAYQRQWAAERRARLKAERGEK